MDGRLRNKKFKTICTFTLFATLTNLRNKVSGFQWQVFNKICNKYFVHLM